MPAMRPWCSACLPSVADTCERETGSSLIGSAPIFSVFARSWAVWIVKPPEIWAPSEPSMPSGYSRKLMDGAETRSLSNTIAKCWDASSALAPGGARSEEHTSELQSHVNLVCRLLLEKKKKKKNKNHESWSRRKRI